MLLNYGSRPCIYVWLFSFYPISKKILHTTIFMRAIDFLCLICYLFGYINRLKRKECKFETHKFQWNITGIIHQSQRFVGTFVKIENLYR